MIGWLNKERWILVALALVLTASILNPGYAAAPSPQENVSLYAGNRLIISSTQQAIRSVVVRGNLSAAIVSNVNYPAENFTITTNSTQFYTLNIWLSYPSTYTTAITINDPVSRSNSLYTSYYVSAGDMNLTIFADFQPAPSNGEESPSPGHRSSAGSASSVTHSPSGSRYSTQYSEHSSPSSATDGSSSRMTREGLRATCPH